MNTEITREALVSLCERAIVPMGRWRNRDSASAQEGIGRAWALLRSGAPFTVLTSGSCATDDQTIWIEIEWPGFNAFEYDRDDRGYWEADTIYIPTEARLTASVGHDWY